MAGGEINLIIENYNQFTEFSIIIVLFQFNTSYDLTYILFTIVL